MTRKPDPAVLSRLALAFRLLLGCLRSEDSGVLRPALVGVTLGETNIETDFGVRVLGILRRAPRSENRIPAPGPDMEIHAQDELLIAPTARTSAGSTFIPLKEKS